MGLIDDTVSQALEVFAPPPDLTVSEWADAERKLSPESSSEPGNWSTDRAPYQREIMDIVNDPSKDEGVMMTSAQVGKTEVLNNIVGYFIDQDPAPVLIVQPTLKMAEDYSKDRLATMIRDTPNLSKKVGDGKAKKTGNTLLHKNFPGGHVTLAGSNSPASLASRPVRVVLLDEVDRFPYSAGTEGDPVNLAKKRTTAFLNRFHFMVSTPTRKGHSRIELAWESSDKRLFKLPCPHCKTYFFLDHRSFYYDPENVDDAAFKCPECEALIEHSEKHEMLSAGIWEITGDTKSRVAGFHLNEFYSPWKAWSEIARDWEEAKKSEETLRVFYNTSLGLPYEAQGDAPEWELLYKRKSDYKKNTLPSEVLFLTASFDVQKDRIETEICGWGTDKRSWSIDYRVFYGDTSQKSTFELIDPLLSETWERDDGSRLSILRCGIDSGYQTQNVYSWARRYPESRVIVLKGQDRLNAIFSMPKNIMKRSKKSRPLVRVWNIGTNLIKRELFSWFKLEEPADSGEPQADPFGFCRFPDNYDQEYFRMLCSESEHVKIVNGFPVYHFVKTRDRNEALDLRVYNRAVASTLGIDSLSNEGLQSLFERSLRLVDDPEPQKKPVKIRRKKSSFLK